MKVILAGLGAAVIWTTPALAEPLAASAFGRLPMVNEVRISPDGQRLAIASGDGGQGAVGLVTLDKAGLMTAKLGDVDIQKMQWLGDDYVLAEVSFRQKLAGRLLEMQRVVAIGAADGHIASTLLQHDIASANLVRQGIAGAFPGPPPRVWMVGAAGRIGKELITRELFRVDPATGVGEPAEKGGPRTLNWGFGSDGQPSGRLDGGEHGGIILLTRAALGAPWTPFWASKDEAEARGYQGESAADKGIYISHSSEAGRQLVIKHFADGSETPVGPPHLEEPVRTIWDPYLIRLSARGFGYDAITYEWYDPELAAIHAAVARAFPGRDADVLDWSRDRTRFVVWVNGQDAPLTWYLYDRTRKEISPVAESYPELKEAQLGTTSRISYKARDGLTIPAYLTLPPGGASAGRKLPLIVVVHDGPAERTSPNFSPLTQFLATRGYAVLRPQFRGSSGLGKAFEEAGDGQWASGIETDLQDGVAELGRQGVIDPKRVCIVGEGFGGYAALAGAALYPDAYACAVSLSGVSNLKVLIANSGTAFRSWATRVRKIPYRDPLYDAMSPSLHAAAVRAPILLVSVDKDPEAPPEQTQLMREALTAAHKPFEDLVLTDTDHDLNSAAVRTKWFSALEAFLAKNLPVH